MAAVLQGSKIISDQVRLSNLHSVTRDGWRYWEGRLELPPMKYLTGRPDSASEYTLLKEDDTRIEIQILEEKFTVKGDETESPVLVSFRSSLPYDLPPRPERSS